MFESYAPPIFLKITPTRIGCSWKESRKYRSQQRPWILFQAGG